MVNKRESLDFPGGPAASPVAQKVKRLSAMRETRVQSPGQEDLLQKAMATHSSFLAWKIPWMEEPGRLPSVGLQRVRHNLATSLSFIFPGGPVVKTVLPMQEVGFNPCSRNYDPTCCMAKKNIKSWV